MLTDSAQTDDVELTGEETKVIGLEPRSHLFKTLALKLDIDPRTVERHVENIRIKESLASARN